MQTPAPHGEPHPLSGFLADCRKESDKPFAIAVIRQSRPEGITEKVKRLLRAEARIPKTLFQASDAGHALALRFGNGR